MLFTTERRSILNNGRKKTAALLAAVLLAAVSAGPWRVYGAVCGQASVSDGGPAAYSMPAEAGSRLSVSPLTGYNDDVAHLAYVTETEDQAQTNYCWAYMADAVLESHLLRTGRTEKNDFSESDMIYQMGNGGAYGFLDLTRGGNFHQAVAYWTRGSRSGPCRESDGTLTDYYVSGTIELGKYQKDNVQEKQDYIRDIKNLVTQYGAVGVSVYFNAFDRLQTTNNGAYYYPQENSPGVNHGVTIVGWNDYYPASWFYNTQTTPRQPSGPGAFLVKNSWGSNDYSSINGNTGYYWISYENYFQDAFTVSQVVSRSALYDRIYETDYRGLSEYAAGSSYGRTYHLASTTEQLTGFATYVKAGAYYRFFVNGSELTQFSGTMADSGYRTFRLAEPLRINGTVLQLQVEVTGSDEAVPISCTADSQILDSGNICLKAFTLDHTAQNPGNNGNTGNSGNNGNTGNAGNIDRNPVYPYYGVITGVSISPRESSLRPGMSQSFQAAVTGTGRPSQQVSWQLSGSSSSYTKLENGVLYVGNDEASKEIFVYAVSDADVTKSAVAKVYIEKAQDQTAGKYTVSFVNEGEVCKTQTAAYGTAAEAPVLVKEGYTLHWDCDFSYIIGNTVVNAVWIPVNADAVVPPAEDEEPDISDEEETDDGFVKNIEKGRYTCWKDGTAWYTKCTAKNQIMVMIPAKIQADGMSYTVTRMEENCVRKNKKILTAVVGKNITEIGDFAFAGCRQLKKIKIKSEQLQAIGEGAFNNISDKAAIYVPRANLAEYREMIRLSGNTKVRVKAFG